MMTSMLKLKTANGFGVSGLKVKVTKVNNVKFVCANKYLTKYHKIVMIHRMVGLTLIGHMGQ